MIKCKGENKMNIDNLIRSLPYEVPLKRDLAGEDYHLKAEYKIVPKGDTTTLQVTLKDGEKSLGNMDIDFSRQPEGYDAAMLNYAHTVSTPLFMATSLKKHNPRLLNRL